MRRTIRTAVGVTAALVLVLGLAAPAGAVAGGAAEAGADTAVNGWRPPAVNWQPCPEQPDQVDLRCATLAVPVDWSRPRGATFPLAIAKRAATGPAATRIGPLLINPGGPGGSGVQAVIDRYERYGSPAVRSRFDLVGFDPRGVGRSNPIRCSATLLAAQPFFVPSDQHEYRELVAHNHRLYDNCRAHTGPLFDHVDSVSVAHDMDAIRAALGARQISYFGVSYGTLMGQMYAERYPDRVRALVLNSTMDHSLGIGAFVRTESVGAENSFTQFVAWCEQDSGCALHGRDVPGLFASLMRRAEAGTLVEPESGRNLSWLDLSSLALNAFYGPRWSGLAEQLAAMADSPPARDGSSTGRERLAGQGDAVADELVEYPMPVFCQDWALPVGSLSEFQRYMALARSTAPNMRGSAPAIMATSVCLDWKGAVNNPQHRLRVRTDLPLLVINSHHDPVTPWEWAVNVADQLGRHGRLVGYAGWGHGVHPGTPCTNSHIDRYLIDRTLPPPGATCAAPEPTAKPDAKPSAEPETERGPEAERRTGPSAPAQPAWSTRLS
ncbi:alpha/beta hydrolase family protein [Micromonospora pisi]|uniref:Alpha/beta hydrolase family protein n=1 Tax=Micromonospora pisi TaxID=589240 RepID=A0A495JKX2_9ACTN|nr:alpha/beta fold hydrolase [Micromonospora pisi]RKR88679.1 alpha/beta hydrolase family protein [Micromonospora pisi]